MADARKIGPYALRKKRLDSEEKENLQPAKKKRVLKDCECVRYCGEKNPAFQAQWRKSSAEASEFKFKETAFHVYADKENENAEGGTSTRGTGRRVDEKRSKDALERKSERGLARIVISSERKDALNRRGKSLNNKNDGQRILADKEPPNANVNHERVLRNRLPGVLKPDIKLQQRKDENKLIPRVPAIVISRRSSCTDAAQDERPAPKTSLRKAASVTSIPAAASEDVFKRPTKLFESRALKRTASALSLAVPRQGREDATKKKISPIGKPALKEKKRNLLVPDAKQAQPKAANGLPVTRRSRSKSAELVESEGKNFKVPESKQVKKSEKKWRIRFRSTDEILLKNIGPRAERKTSLKDNVEGLQESDQVVSKNKDVQKHTSSRTSDKMYLRSMSSKKQNETITPVDGAPVPTPKKAKLEHRACESDTGVRELKETAPSPWELAYHLQYLDDTMETEWEKHNNAYKLSADFLKRNINSEQRRIIIGFLIHVGYHCHYPSFILYQTVKLFDAAMDVTFLDIAEFQLAALACLFIALKKEENIHKVPTASTILSFAKDQYEGRTDLLLKCEQLILRKLNFQIAFSDPYTLFVYYLFHCKQYVVIDEQLTSQLYYSAGYMIDISLLDEDFCHVSAILLAITVAELLFCMFLDSEESYARPRWLYWRSLIGRDSKNPDRFCSATIDSLRANLICNTLRSNRDGSLFKTVYKKYKLNRYGKVTDTLIAKVAKLPCEQYLGFQ